MRFFFSIKPKNKLIVIAYWVLFCFNVDHLFALQLHIKEREQKHLTTVFYVSGLLSPSNYIISQGKFPEKRLSFKIIKEDALEWSSV